MNSQCLFLIKKSSSKATFPGRVINWGLVSKYLRLWEKFSFKPLQ